MKSIHFEDLHELDNQSSEAYKTLRTNIKFCGEDVKTILITSCMPNEGKSSVTFNLARSFAEDGNKVVLIDADLRKSVMVGRYKVDGAVMGLSHYLSGQQELADVLVSTNVPGMDIIFAGKVPPNPAELLGGKVFKEMIEELRDTYDYVLIDSSPLGTVIDSAVMAPVADGAVMVVESNAVSYKMEQDVKGQLEKTGCRILGVVLNKVVVKKKGLYGKYYVMEQ